MYIILQGFFDEGNSADMKSGDTNKKDTYAKTLRNNKTIFRTWRCDFYIILQIKSPAEKEKS